MLELERGKALCTADRNGTWKPMSRPLVVDSGAAETVLPMDWVTEHELVENEESKNGLFYVTADATEINNMGENTLSLATIDSSSVQERNSRSPRCTRLWDQYPR